MKVDRLETIIGIMLIILALCVGIIEYSNYEINKFDNEITDLEIATTNLYLDVIALQTTYLQFDLYNMFQPNIFLSLNESGKNYEKKFSDQYINGNLSKSSYIYLIKLMMQENK
jgi:hypothetical protein